MDPRPLLFLLLAAGCAAPAAGCKRHAPPSTDPPTDQPTRGLVVYVNTCAGCHGENGEGDEDKPPLVGANALPRQAAAGRTRQASFVTAKDLFDYTKASMPQLAPGSLSDEQCWEVVAYLLKANGVAASGDLGPANAPSVKLGR
jgi:mono/diheme cytochrome c family protein